MKRSLIALALFTAFTTAHATAWTYHGTLNDGGKPAHGRYDLRLSMLDSTGGKSVGGMIVLPGVLVSNGSFSVDVDFGFDLTQFAALKLKTEVQQGNSGFVSLGGPAHFDAKAALAGICWDTTGNVVAAGEFLGSSNNVPVEIKANGDVVARFGPHYLTDFGGPLVRHSPNVVFGDFRNSVAAGLQGGTIGGGGTGDLPTPESRNHVAADFGTVAGGNTNTVGVLATGTGFGATVSGGTFNHAYADGSVVAGGNNNSAGFYATVSGGSRNCAGGDYSWAGGSGAEVRTSNVAGISGCDAGLDANGDEGTFMWSDSQSGSFTSSGPNQFLVRADGGVMFNANTLTSPSIDDFLFKARPLTGDSDVDLRMVTRNGKSVSLFVSDSSASLTIQPIGLSAASPRLIVSGGTGGSASLTHGGAWTNASSRAYKEAFAPVDAIHILNTLVALPITTWTYRESGEGTHMGPMAEDFKAAFDLAGDGDSIATVDADGVALAAIQGLNKKLEAENAELREHDAMLGAQLEVVLKRLSALESARAE